MKTNNLGLDLIKRFEGLSLKPYKCPADIPTIGYGSTFYEDGAKVTLNDAPITGGRAEKILQNVLVGFEKAVLGLVTTPINENQFSALVSLCYNIGIGNLKSSTLLRKINEGDFGTASAEFLRWNKAGGKALSGLTMRRQAEKDLFLKKPLH